jgi:very-short-patch-repair endonuclease
MIRQARKLRSNLTKAESMLWQGLRRRQLGWHFRRQHPIPPYIVDFACPEAKLVVEADGGQHIRPGDHAVRDEQLRREGWRILHFWNNDILENRAAVFETIAAALDPYRPDRPRPPP